MNDRKIIAIVLPMMMMVMTLAIVFVVQGYRLQNQVTGKEAAFHQLQTDYFVNNTKAERDSAPAGSVLNQQLAEIQNAPSELLRLKLVGVGKILTGIFVVLSGILMSMFLMPIRLGHRLHGILGRS